MSYELKFKTLIATLKAALPTIQIDAHDDRRRQDVLAKMKRYKN